MKAPQLYLTTGMSLEVQLSQIDENVNGRFLVSAMITVRSIIAKILISFYGGCMEFVMKPNLLIIKAKRRVVKV